MSTPVTAASGSPAGWYADPSGLPVLRWWDGVAWTPQTHQGAPQAPVQILVKNSAATAALVLGLVALAVNTFLVTSTTALVLAIVGLVKASSLQRQGLAPVGRAKAVWAIVLAFLAGGFTTFFKFFLF